ncbi:MAG: hypothetical protein LQ338_002064 [Usnochroma carphineum]|nr:MAG: hypothetical protein LQ338_002064 [Usnochroma carphineum]
MDRMGLSRATQDKIMDPLFEGIRQTGPITYWALDTVRENWKTLLQLQRKVKAAAIYTRAKKNRKSTQGWQQPALGSPQQRQRLSSQVSKAFIYSLGLKELWCGPDWEDFVWHSRRSLSPPPEFNDYVSNGRKASQ